MNIFIYYILLLMAHYKWLLLVVTNHPTIPKITTFYRWYGYHSHFLVVYGIALPTLLSICTTRAYDGMAYYLWLLWIWLFSITGYELGKWIPAWGCKIGVLWQ